MFNHVTFVMINLKSAFVNQNYMMNQKYTYAFYMHINIEFTIY